MFRSILLLRTVKEIVKENVFTYFNLIFTVLGVLLVIVGSFKDLSFMLIVLANTVIGIAQEIRSKQTLDKLKLLKMPKSHVVRDGREEGSSCRETGTGRYNNSEGWKPDTGRRTGSRRKRTGKRSSHNGRIG